MQQRLTHVLFGPQRTVVLTVHHPVSWNALLRDLALELIRVTDEVSVPKRQRAQPVGLRIHPGHARVAATVRSTCC